MPRFEFIRLHSKIFRVNDIISIELECENGGEFSLFILLKNTKYLSEIKLIGYTLNEAIDVISETCDTLNSMYD